MRCLFQAPPAEWEAATPVDELGDGVRVSARDGAGIPALVARIAARLGADRRTYELRLSAQPDTARAQLSFLYSHPRVTVLGTDVAADGEAVVAKAAMEAQVHRIFARRYAGE